MTPIAGETYYSRSVADCAFDRFILGPKSAAIQVVHADGTIAYAKSFPVAS